MNRSRPYAMNERQKFNPRMPWLVAFAIVLVGASFASACPTCANGMAGDSAQHQARIDGYFYSILLMMSMPFVLIGSFGVYMYREVRKARARQLSDQQLADQQQREQKEGAKNEESVEQGV